MLTPLVPVNLPSIYNNQPLPNLRWSDLFRSYEMQKAGATLDNAEQVLAPRLQETFPQ